MTSRTRERRQCPVCGRPYWTSSRYRQQRTCAEPACRRAMQAATHAANWGESAERIEAAYQAARAARLARERATGSRTYTVTDMDAWTQPDGRSALDGEMRAVEMGDA